MQKLKSMTVETSVMINRTGSISLKTTIPETYVNLLKLQPKDRLVWDHEIVDGQIVIRLQKKPKVGDV